MTPKEQAIDLVSSMGISTSWATNYTGGEDYPMYKNQYAKECALIAVNKIIANIEPSVSMDVIESRINYWQEVKQEIEKL